MSTSRIAWRLVAVLSFIFVVASFADQVRAGTFYTWLVLDPGTTAGAGVPGIPAVDGTQLSVSSSRSGPGTFHVFALDDTTGGNGIRSFFIKINNATAINNRAPQAIWDDVPFFGDGTIRTAGFDSIRASFPMLNGSQGNSPPFGNTVPQIGGFGISAGDMGSVITGEQSFGGYGSGAASGAMTSPRWGVYSLFDGQTSGPVASGHRSGVFLGEGTYNIIPPFIDVFTPFASGGTGFTVWNAAGFPNNGSFTVAAEYPANTLVNHRPLFPEPSTLSLIGLAMAVGLGLVRRRS